MRAFVVVLGLALALSGADGPFAATAAEQLVFVRDGDLWTAAPDGSNPERLTRSAAAELEPAVAPDGQTVAFAGNRTGDAEIYRARILDWAAVRLSPNPGHEDTAPAWSPDGRTIAWTSDGDIFTMTADGNARRAVAATPADELDPAWSPDGREIVYAADGDLVVATVGGAARRITAGPEHDGEPDWSRSGEIAFVRDGAVHVVSAAGGPPRRLTTGPADAHPSWSPDGRRLVFARAGPRGSDLLVAAADGTGVGVVIAGAREPDWGIRRREPPAPPRPRERPDELLPDLDQRAPSGLVLTASRGRFKLGFVSAVDNIGRGPVWIVASRRSTVTPTMRATQLVRLRGGGRRVYRTVGIVRYTRSPTHSHWHYLRFMTYELRRASDFALAVRDRKSGFCLADHYGYAAARLGRPRPRPRFLGNCERDRPHALWVEQGSSVGFTDRYPAHFHGQNVDVTGLQAGAYWLVHRANPFGRLRERRLTNNAASLLVRLSWPRGPRRSPSVAVLRVCEAAERCPAGLP